MADALGQRHALGSLIREARKRRGLTIEELARAAGTSRYTLMNLEQGRKAVGSDTLVQVLLILELLSEEALSALRAPTL